MTPYPLSSWTSPHARPKLLVVDDQPVNIRLLHGMFRDEFEVLMATDGAQALQVCREQAPDLVLLDVVMPGLDGHEVCRRLKADGATREIPVIFITGHHDVDDEVKGFELGAVDFISKPINPVITQARVRNHIALKIQSDLLRSIAMLDGLTGVANRRKFDEALDIDWRQCQRDEKPLSLCLVDVDCFKRYNDRYGHQAGDLCLRAVAQALKRALLRPYDSVARYGGEEFVCLLPDVDAAGAMDVAERLLAQVRALQIEHLDNDRRGVVTVSIGVATARPSEGRSAEALLAAADRSLYDAKHAGRDCYSGTLLE